jgi:hypothetical protein
MLQSLVRSQFLWQLLWRLLWLGHSMLLSLGRLMLHWLMRLLLLCPLI